MKTAAKLCTLPLFASLFVSLLVTSNIHGQQADADLKIRQLKVERQKMLEAYGPRHPSVKAIDKIIENESKHSQLKKSKRSAQAPAAATSKVPNASTPKTDSSPSAQSPLESLSDAELRLTVQRLLKRVEALEREVQQLKNPPAKTQLLGR